MKSSCNNKPKLNSTAKINVFLNINIETIQDLTKQQRQNLINEKIKEREKLYKIQAENLSKIQNKEVQRLNKQIDELQKKQQEIARKKEEDRKKLRDQYEESLKNQV